MPLGTIFLLLATTSLVHAVQTFHQFLPYTIGRTYLRIKTINYQNMKTSFLQHKSISILKWNRKKIYQLSKLKHGLIFTDWYMKKHDFWSLSRIFFLPSYIHNQMRRISRQKANNSNFKLWNGLILCTEERWLKSICFVNSVCTRTLFS